MKIEKWQVENGIAKPCNPYEPQWFDFNKREVDSTTNYASFEKEAKQHTFATSAPPGIHSA